MQNQKKKKAPKRISHILMSLCLVLMLTVSFSIPSRAVSTQVRYGEWIEKRVAITVSGSTACTSNVSGSKTFNFYPSGSYVFYGLTRGHVYQLENSALVSSYSNHQHENDFIYGSNISVSEGSWSVSASGTSPFTYDGTNNPTIRVSFPVTVYATAENLGNSSYPVYTINGSVSCSYDVVVYFRYREVFNYTQSQKFDTMNDNINRLADGYDSTAGNEANDKLSGTLNEYQTAEDSLFSTVSTGLDDYEFYDMNSTPVVLTGISFISVLMESWFDKAGGSSGIGIIISILLTITLISIVVGISKYYQSKKE